MTIQLHKSVIGTLFFFVVCFQLQAQEALVPDPQLRRVIKETLELADNTVITEAHLHSLTDIGGTGVKDLTGLEHATNLQQLGFQLNFISDLTPISELTQLKGLYLGGNQITDITPLRGLINLEVLHLWANQIIDITPLANLTNLWELRIENNIISDLNPLSGLTRLKSLFLGGNRIENISPLAGLLSLTELWLDYNEITNWTPIENLPLQILHFRENPGDVTPILKFTLENFSVCEIDRLPVTDRIENREYPSIFAAWANIINMPTVSEPERMAYHDLYMCCPFFGLYFVEGENNIHIGGNLTEAKKQRDALLEQNPNLVILVAIGYFSGVGIGTYPDDWENWLRDENDEIVIDPLWGEAFLDFTLPETQAWTIAHATAVAQCGLFDGIFLDHWNEGSRLYPYRSVEAEHAARDAILKGIREAVGDDFLIMVNTNEAKIPRWASYINGTFMETFGDVEYEQGIDVFEGDGYTYKHLQTIEDTLLWSEKHFREPQINGLEGFGISREPPDSPRNQQGMRLFTTMSLTHSDGYVLYNIGNASQQHTHPWDNENLAQTWGHANQQPHVHDHDHYWYEFYDAPLGKPIGGDETKAKIYNAIEGVFIREFTNGWAVYNRSGNSQRIQLPEKVSGVASRVQNKRWHTIPDLDGEIYLKASPTSDPTGADTVAVIHAWDVNKDGSINKTDLLLVAANIGVDPPTIPRADVNGDGRITVADLQLVIDNLDDPTTATAPILAGDLAIARNPKLRHAELSGVGTDAQAFSEAIALLQRLLANIHPQKTQLLANFPNPFNPETWIPYELATDTDVRITIYNAQGVVIQTLQLGQQSAGYYTDRERAAYWDGRNTLGERVASGVYFYQLETDELSALRKMVILK